MEFYKSWHLWKDFYGLDWTHKNLIGQFYGRYRLREIWNCLSSFEEGHIYVLI